MPSEKKRAYLALAVLAVFVAAFASLFASDGADPFRPAVGATPWVSVLSGLCILLLAVSVLCFRRGLRPSDLLGDEREQELALRAGLLAKTFVLALLFGLGMWLESAAGAEGIIHLPRRAIGFSLASLMAAYLGARAVAVLILYGRE
jgi:hypothetical protein